MALIPAGQANHIEINAGNVFTIGLLAILFNVAAAWTSNVLARTEIPGLSQLSIGMQYALHGA